MNRGHDESVYKTHSVKFLAFMSVLEHAIPADFSLYVRRPIGLLKKLSVKLDCYSAKPEAHRL